MERSLGLLTDRAGCIIHDDLEINEKKCRPHELLTGYPWVFMVAFSPDKLIKAVVRAVKSPDNDVAVSVVKFLEISLKYALGKLELTGGKPEELPDFAGLMNLEILPDK